MGKMQEVRFEITLCWKVPGAAAGSRVLSKTAILQEKKNCKVNGESEHKFVKVIHGRNDKDRVKSIHNWKQVKGAVAISKMDYQTDVDVVVEELEKHGSVAAFMLLTPTVTTSIPVFVLSQEEFKLVLEFEPKFLKIRVKRVPSHPLELSDGESERLRGEVEGRSSGPNEKAVALENSFEFSDSASVGGESKGESTGSGGKAVTMEEMLVIKVEYTLNIEDKNSGDGQTLQLTKFATLFIDQDPSEFEIQSLLVRQGVLHEGKIINQKVKDLKSDSPVLYFSSDAHQDQGTFKTIASESAKYKVPALIVTQDPGIAHTIPVFVFDEDEMRDLISFDTALISITVLGNSKEDRRGTSESARASPSITDSYAVVARNDSVGRQAEINDASEGEKESEGLFKFIRRGFSNLIFTPKVRPALKKIFEGWSEDGLESYNAALVQLKMAIADDDRYAEIGEIRKQLLEYMSGRDSNGIMLIAFSCQYLIEIPFNKDHAKNVRRAIVECISRLEMVSTFKLSDATKSSYSKGFDPCESLMRFISNRLQFLGSTRKKVDEIVALQDQIPRLVWIHNHHCGKKFEWSRLLDLIRCRPQLLRSGLFCENLEAQMGQVELRSLVFFSQTSLRGICDVITEYVQRGVQGREMIQLTPTLDVKHWIIKIVKSKRIDEALCRGFVECMQFIQFTWENEILKKKMATSIVSSFCHQNTRRLPILWQFVDVEHYDRTHFQETIIKILETGLCATSWESIKPDDVKCLFDSCVSSFLGSKKLYKPMDQYTSRLMKQKWYKFEDKINFLGAAYSNFANVADVGFEDISKFVLYSLHIGLTSARFCHLIFKLAACNADLFSEQVNDECVAESVAELVIRKAQFSSSDDIRGINFMDLQAGRLMKCLTSQLSQSLCDKCGKDIERSACLYNDLFCDAKPSLNSLLNEVLTSTLQQWDPKKVIDILCFSSTTLGAVSDFFCRNAGDANVHSSGTTIREIFEHFNNGVRTNGIKLRDINVSLEYYDPKKWNAIKNITGFEVATKIELGQALREMDEACDEINKTFSIPCTSGELSLLDIFKRYECNVNSDIGIAGILNECNELDSSHLKHTLSSIKNLAQTLTEFLARFHQQIGTLSYFVDVKVDCDLFYESIKFGSWTCIGIDEILGVVKNAEIFLTDLGKSLKRDPLRAIKNAVDLITNAPTAPRDLRVIGMLRKSFSLVAGCPTIAVDLAEQHTFTFVSSLVAIMEKLHIFVSCSRQFQFQFVTSDDSFENLDKISNEIKSNDTSHIDIDTARAYARTIVDIFSISCETLDDVELGRAVDGCVSLFAIFENIRNSPDVFIFVREQGWSGEEGRQQFYAEFGNVTNKLLFANSDSFESNVLDSLEPAVRALSILASLQDESSLQTFMSTIKGSIDAGANSRELLKSNLETIQQNIRSVREWFNDEIDDATAIFSTFKNVWDTGAFLCEKNILCLSYESGDGKVNVSGSDLEDLVQQLGFVQHEDEQVGSDITTFLDNLQLLKKVVEIICNSERVGYSKGDIAKFMHRINEPLSSATILLTKANQMLQECNTWFEALEKKYPLMTLFSVSDLRVLHGAIVNFLTEPCNDELNVIVPTLATIVPPTMLVTLRGDIIAFCTECLVAMETDFLEEKLTWLEAVSKFIEVWHNKLGKPRYSKSSNGTRSGIFLHSFDCESRSKDLMIVGAMNFVYKNRLPEPFEVYDASCNNSLTELQLFLRRVVIFPQSTFMLLNIQDLPGNQQETVVNYVCSLATSEIMFNLHCVQISETMLHSSPSVEHIIWNEVAFKGLNIDRWKSCINEQSNFNSITVVTSSVHSTGKTRFVYKEMDKLQSEDGNLVRGSICIHEGTSLDSLIQSLNNFRTITDSHVAIHFSFMLPLESYSSRLLTELNYFFNHFLLTRCVKSHRTGDSFAMGWTKWNLFIELPGCTLENTPEIYVDKLLSQYLPIISVCASIVLPPNSFDIDSKARRVSTYLRAYKDGTINRKFEIAAPKQLMFVIDDSGSMGASFDDGRTAFAVAISNALEIFDSHVHIGDFFGTIIFSNIVRVVIPITQVRDDAHKQFLRNSLANSRFSNGGTSMYIALNSAIAILQEGRNRGDTWIICLTDGVSDSKEYDDLRRALIQSAANLHVMMVGVNLYLDYQDQMKSLCEKFEVHDTKGIFIPSQANVESLRQAFGAIAARIPVSQTFELDGVLSDEECTTYINAYLPVFVSDHDMLRKRFWIEFLFRRVKVFDENEAFNYNESNDNLGSSLIEVMLQEAERLISTEHNKRWKESNHEQLIYDFTSVGSPEFRLICTAPDLMTEESLKRYKALDLPGFYVPTAIQLRDRTTLDRFLSQALNVPLAESDDGLGRLQCIDDNRFVLTLDFVIKMLNMHERISCRIPCIIEGETGVSKTALTKMYSILRNSSLTQKLQEDTDKELQSIVDNLKKMNLIEDSNDETSSKDNLRAAIKNSSSENLGTIPQLNIEVCRLLLESSRSRSSIFMNNPVGWLSDNFNADSRTVIEMLDWFASSILERTFFELNVDASLTEGQIVDFFDDVCRTARKVEDSGALVVVFLDEINTSSVMGLFKEIIIDSSICGKTIENNIVVVAACNPANRTSLSKNCDLAKDWASGHYQVSELPPSLASLKWKYGALNAAEEKEFVLRKIEMLEIKIPTYLQYEFTAMVAASQDAIRTLAAEEIERGLKRSKDEGSNPNLILEARTRAKATVSLRDIQRVFSLFQFFTTDFPLSSGEGKDAVRTSMLLTIAIVYYLRLDYKNRKRFLIELSNVSIPLKSDFTRVLKCSMDQVTSETKVPPGIALTDGLKENIFMTLVCSLSLTPLVIIGPPGSSKTLSLNIIDDNANGLESPERFYRQLPRLSTYHYQCSRSSTSSEVSSVFEKAIQRQSKVDSKEHKCLVFMDEAGLPEESKESLKVLHYYLEGHMSIKAKVAFVAITNHVLDAAKSNRCVSLLRQDPREQEMLQIAQGVLFAQKDGGLAVKLVNMGGNATTRERFASLLCVAYKRVVSKSELEDFFGLRDFIYLLQDIRTRSQLIEQTLHISSDILLHALERNFNGLQFKAFQNLALKFIQDCGVPNKRDLTFLPPSEVVREALSVENTSNCRYSLIIDESDDDSIMRILKNEGLLDISRKSLFKLSNLHENAEFEKVSLVSGVKFAARQGSKVVLSQTDSVNESFYDLFNQHFKRITNRTGEVCLFANIAVGGISRRSRVGSTFRCIVHVRASELPDLPAPFLNRFEKYRLSITDLFTAKVNQSSLISRIFSRSLKQINKFVSSLTLCGFVPLQTIESCMLELLSGACENEDSCVCNMNPASSTFYDHFVSFLKSLLNLTVPRQDLINVMAYAKDYLPLDEAEALTDLLAKSQLLHAKEAFQECFKATPSTIVAVLVEKILEMVITRHVILTLSNLATPEEIYVSRTILPQDVIQHYFEQQHFSLKDLLENIRSKAFSSRSMSKYIIHTRSNAHILGIPSLRTDVRQSNSIEVARNLITDSPATFIIEHMNLLKDESSVRSAIVEWSNNEKVESFLLLIDMSDPSSIEVVNFVRCCIDQLPPGKCKTFALLLHYSPASFLSKSFYPALFLDDWRHVSLDDVDGAARSNEVKHLIEKACNLELPSTNDIRNIVNGMVKDIRKTIACHEVFYESQVNSTYTVHQRRSWLDERLATCICGTTIEEILCDKFALLWTPKNLEKLLKRASWSLRKGTSMLGLTRCLKTIIRDIMHKFFLHYMLLLNEWKNLDLLQSSCQSDNLNALFCDILRKIPVLPFEELVLHQIDLFCGLKSLPLLSSSHIKLEAKFPFFSLVCTLLNSVVEDSFKNTILDCETDLFVDEESIINDAMDRLRENRIDSMNSEIVLMVIDKAMRSEFIGTGTALFDMYLDQFICWTLGYSLDSFAAKWFKEKFDGPQQNLLIIHICAIRYKMELIRLNASKEDEATCLDCDEFFGDGSISDLPTPSCELVEARCQWLVLNLRLLRQTDTAIGWAQRFLSLCESLPDMMGSGLVKSETVANWLRLTSFFYILQIHTTLPETMENAIRIFCDENEALHSKVDTQLELFFRIVNGSDEEKDCKKQFFTHLLEHYFSRSWVSTVDLHWKSDLTFLLSNSLSLCDGASEVFMLVLLRNALIYGGKVGDKNAEDEVKGDLQRLSTPRLAVINSQLSCSSVSNYSAEGHRLSIPHFIPKFALDPEFQEDFQGEEMECPNKDLSVYFSHYKSAFSLPHLTEAIFQVVLEEIAQKSKGMSSEDLFLAFMRNMELETTLSRVEQTRILRTECTLLNSFVGTPLGILILEARLIIFIFSSSFELGNNQAFVFESLHSHDAWAVVDHVMTMRGTLWQELFMSNIERVFGRVTLTNMLRSGGCLHSRPWAVEWSGGLPELATDIEGDLSIAEREFRDVSSEENRKAREMRLCPLCTQPFMVSEWNCGQFICGRANTHTAPRDEMHGCGHEFSGAVAPFYQIDENNLETLGQKVKDEKLRLQRHGAMSKMWENLGVIKLPYLSSQLDGDNNHFYPLSIAIKSVGSKSDTVRHIILSQKDIESFLLIPDLIELYCWMQNTFRYIISFEQATTLLLSDVMNGKVLSARFDSLHSNHILMVYKRAKDGLNRHLSACDYKVNWDCETIEVPFRQLEDASMVHLLSVYDHPTDGCDYFFIIINQLIQQYNQFILKMFNQDTKEILPLALLGPYSAALKSLRFFNTEDFSLLVDGYRKKNEDDYEINALERHIERLLAPIHFTVKPPIQFLRTKFQFRTGIISDKEVNNDQGITGLKSSAGHYFVHTQDVQLFETCLKHATKLRSQSSMVDLSYYFTSKFHSLDYEQLREVLEGLRNLLQSTVLYDDQTLHQCLKNNELDDTIDLNDFGFPSSLSVPQVGLLLSLKTTQIIPFIQYLGFQLASESYNFAALPLSMKSLLSACQREALRHNIIEAFNSVGSGTTLQLLREFKEDILGFYQRIFREECNQHAKEKMKDFLESNNFSDDSDTIFSALPDDITTRHYVALHQELHQLHLSLLSREHDVENDDDLNDDEVKQSFAKPRRGDFWLLYNDKENQESNDVSHDTSSDSSSMDASADSSDLLWFECALQKKEENQYQHVPLNLEDNDSLSAFGSEVSIDESSVSSGGSIAVSYYDSNGTSSSKANNNLKDINSSRIMASTIIQRWWRSRSIKDRDIVVAVCSTKEGEDHSAISAANNQRPLSSIWLFVLFFWANVAFRLAEFSTKWIYQRLPKE